MPPAPVATAPAPRPRSMDRRETPCSCDGPRAALPGLMVPSFGQTCWPDGLPSHHHAAVLRGDAVQFERHAHTNYGFVGSRSAFTCTFLFCVLSTTFISKGYLPELSFHWTPTTGTATTPGAGPLVKLSGPD